MDELYYLWKTLMEEDADSVTEGGTWGSATLDSLFGCPTVDNVVAQDDDVIPGKKATESPPWKWRDGKEVRQPRLNTPVSLELSTENADTSEGRRTTNAEVMRSPDSPTKESKPKIYRSMDSSVSLAPDVEKRSRNNHGGGRPSSRPRSSFQTAEEEHKRHYARPMGHSSYAYPDYTKESSTSVLPRQKTEVRSSSVRDVHLRSNNDYYMLSRKSNSQINRRAGSMPISSIQRRPAPHGGKNCMHTRSNSQINHRGASVGMPRSSTRGIPAPLVGGYRYVIESRDPRPTYYSHSQNRCAGESRHELSPQFTFKSRARSAAGGTFAARPRQNEEARHLSTQESRHVMRTKQRSTVDDMPTPRHQKKARMTSIYRSHGMPCKKQRGQSTPRGRVMLLE